MDTNAQVQKAFTEPAMESFEVASAVDQLCSDRDAVRRSEKNILQWMEYLPEDCINRMIEMGWDVTT